MTANQLRRLVGIGGLVFSAGCGVGEAGFQAPDDSKVAAAESGSTEQGVSCGPLMSVFPVGSEHNIGYDSSCNDGRCDLSCPDSRANSDWSPAQDHHGIDVFAFYRAPLVATVTGTITRVGTVSSTSGIRVRLRDNCGWEYYYGHMDQAIVSQGQHVTAGQVIGYMGSTGAASVHLHFNVSPDGNYSSDINPLNLLVATSPTACGAAPPPAPPVVAPPPVTQPAGCGSLVSGEALLPGQSKPSCDGRFALTMQEDGNLVLYLQGWPIWNTGTSGRGGAWVAMQGDGNFVLYSAGGSALWHTHTNGSLGAYLAIQDDGNLVLYDNGAARWNSGTCCH